jgi:hypothetical protein
LQAPPKFTQIGIFGLKVNHLATLASSIGGILNFYSPNFSTLICEKGFCAMCPHFLHSIGCEWWQQQVKLIDQKKLAASPEFDKTSLHKYLNTNLNGFALL